MEGREMVNPKGRVGTKFIDKSDMKIVVETLNDLITDNLAVMHIYQTAVDHLENDENITMLQDYAQQHHTYAKKLTTLVTDYSGEPETDEAGSLVKRAWVTLKAAIEQGDGPIISSVAEDAENILESYREALSEDLPDDAHDMIRDHLTGARLAAEKLVALSVALNN